MKTWQSILLAFGLMLVALLIGGVGGYFLRKGREPVVKRDTVVNIVTYHDTVTVIHPVEIAKTIVRKERVVVTDTIVRNDTTYIELPVERKVYADSNYRAVVSGIRPSLDEISVFPETKVVTQTITVAEVTKPKRFSLGVQGGWYVIYDAAHKQVATGPGAGAGLSFGWTF